MGKRALGAVRISVGGANQTGPETQRDRITKRAIAEDMELVAIAEDIDVSASVSPFLRPDLGEWLTTRKDEWDVLIVLKIDRLVRSIKYLSEFLDWCEANGKSLISVEEGFDLSQEWGRTIVKILAVLAESELNAIKARIKASREAMRKQGRWPGGTAPFGRRSVRSDDGGFTLEIDPEYGPVLMEMIRRFIRTENFSDVADWLNEQGVPTAHDIARMRSATGQGMTRLPDDKRVARGKRWLPGAVKSVLTSRSLLGEYTDKDGNVYRNADGSPVMRSEPVINDAEWFELDQIVQKVTYTKKRGNSTPLIGVLFCGGCDRPLYRSVGNPERGQRHAYYCKEHKPTGAPRCDQHRWFADELEPLIGAILLQGIGDQEVQRMEMQRDDSGAVQLAKLDGQLEGLMSEFQKGKLTAVQFAEMTAKVAGQREELSNRPEAPAVMRLTGIGETYAEWWPKATDDMRRDLMVTNGVVAKATRSDEFPQGVLYVDFGRIAPGVVIRDTLGGTSAALNGAPIVGTIPLGDFSLGDASQELVG